MLRDIEKKNTRSAMSPSTTHGEPHPPLQSGGASGPYGSGSGYLFFERLFRRSEGTPKTRLAEAVPVLHSGYAPGRRRSPSACSGKVVGNRYGWMIGCGYGTPMGLGIGVANQGPSGWMLPHDATVE